MKRITDPDVLKKMVQNTNKFMHDINNEYKGHVAVEKGGLRQDVYDRHQTDDIYVYAAKHGIYKGKYSAYDAINTKEGPHCITFVEDVMKGTGDNSNISVEDLAWKNIKKVLEEQTIKYNLSEEWKHR